MKQKTITGTVTISTKEYNFLRDFKNKISEKGTIFIKHIYDNKQLLAFTNEEAILILNKDFQISKERYEAKIKELEEKIEEVQIPLTTKIKELELQLAPFVNNQNLYTKDETTLFCHQLAERLKNLFVKQFKQIRKGKIKFFTSEEENKY